LIAAPLRFGIPVGQHVALDGKLLRFVRRGRDREARLVFEGADGVPADMTDLELLRLQDGGRLRVLAQAEASDLLEREGKPRVTAAVADPAACEEMRRRHDYVRGWERAGRPSRTPRGIGPVIEAVFEERRARKAVPVEADPPGWRTTLRYIADWVDSGGDPQSLVPQTDCRGNSEDRLHPKAREILESTVDEWYWVDTRPTMVAAHRHVEVAFEDHNAALPEADRLPVPTIKSVRRYIARVDAYTADCTRKGRRAADHAYRPVLSCPATTRHNEVWEIDHTTVNVIVVDGLETLLPIGRPTITAVIDRHTRAVPGTSIGFDPPGTMPVMQCLRHAILPKKELLAGTADVSSVPFMGLPGTIVPDQGREFKGMAFVQGCLSLGIDVQYAPVLKAWYKGKIERFFRTLATDVFHRVPGTTFASWFERNKEAIPESVAVVTLQELTMHVDRYLADIYHRRRHRGLNLSPLEAWNESVRLHPMPVPPDREKVLAALSLAGYRVPQRYGIQFEGLFYNSADVARYRIRAGMPKAVRISVDADDLTSIRFLDPETNAFVTVPIVPGMLGRVRGVTLEKHKLARALQRSNPATLAGKAGLARAYTLIDRAMREKGAKSGLAQRKDAARYWAAATRAARPEEAPAFDAAVGAEGVSEGIYDDGEDPGAGVPDDELVGADRMPGALPADPMPRAGGPPGGDGADPDPAEPAPDAVAPADVPVRRGRPRKAAPAPTPADPDEDLDALARKLGMTVSNKGREQA
jgi:putative transposase